MADFVAVLKKTIGGLSNNTPEARERVYQKARDTVTAKLAAMQPPPSSIVVERQKKALESAISAVEAGFVRDEEPEDEFAAIFSGTGNTKTPDPQPEEVPSETEAEAEAAPDETQPEDEPQAEEPAEEPVEPVSDRPETVFAGAEPELGSADADEKASGDDLKPAEVAEKPDPVLPGTLAGAEAKRVQPERQTKRRMSGGLIAALVAVVVVAGAGYGIWLNRDAFMSMFASPGEIALAPAEEDAAAEEDVAEEAAPAEEAAEEEVAAAEETPAEVVADAPAEEDQEKFTQRLTPEGDEVDAGPAGGEATVGEGTSVASATQSGSESASNGTGNEAPAATTNETALPVGQRAIFYEERTTASDSTAEAGATVWSVVQESPGADQPAEPAIRAEVVVPSKGLQLRMTIRRNADPSLPASHIIEMIFLTDEGFEGGGIDNVLRVAMKGTEAAAGSQLIGIPAKIADGYFLIALSDVPEERDINLQLMRQQSWIDVPIVYKSGRRALVTMERGVPGDRTFVDVLATWEKLTSEESAAAAGN